VLPATACSSSPAGPCESRPRSPAAGGGSETPAPLQRPRWVPGPDPACTPSARRTRRPRSPEPVVAAILRRCRSKACPFFTPPASPGRTAQARACADAVTDARPGPATWAGKGSSSLAETGSVCVREGPATGKAPPPGCQGRIEVLGVGGRVTGLARARTRSKELPSQKLLFGLGHFLSVGSSYRLHQVGLHLENETETD
jgi:hypothetical protein